MRPNRIAMTPTDLTPFIAQRDEIDDKPPQVSEPGSGAVQEYRGCKPPRLLMSIFQTGA